MKTLLVPKFDTSNNYKFTGYKEVKVKNKLDYKDERKVINELPGMPCGYCSALAKITETRKPIEIRRFYDARQNTRMLKNYFITVKN